MPGELPPELVIGLARRLRHQHRRRTTWSPTCTPPAPTTRSLAPCSTWCPTQTTFTVGLGGDELGYWTPINEVRLKCLDLVMPAGSGYTCQRLFDEGLLVTPDAVAGPMCRALTDDAAAQQPHAPTRPALAAVCRYGQALGRELGEPDGHYEETNSAGWDLVDDTVGSRPCNCSSA